MTNKFFQALTLNNKVISVVEYDLEGESFDHFLRKNKELLTIHTTPKLYGYFPWEVHKGHIYLESDSIVMAAMNACAIAEKIKEQKEKSVMAKQKTHNEWFHPLARKSCPCGSNSKRGGAKNRVFAHGCYVYGKWRTLDYFCQQCFTERRIPAIKFSAINDARDVLDVVLVARRGRGPLPEWFYVQWCAAVLK